MPFEVGWDRRGPLQSAVRSEDHVVDGNGAAVDRVDLTLGGQLVGSQSLGGASPSGLPIAFTVNTAVVANGTHPLTAEVFTTENPTMPAATATLSIGIVNLGPT